MRSIRITPTLERISQMRTEPRGARRVRLLGAPTREYSAYFEEAQQRRRARPARVATGAFVRCALVPTCSSVLSLGDPTPGERPQQPIESSRANVDRGRW